MRNIFLLILLILGIACDPKTPVKTEARKEYETEKNVVDTIILRKKDFKNQLISNGKLRAINKSSLRFSSNGIVTGLKVRNGSYVQKGDTIAYLDNKEILLKLEQAELQMKKARLNLEDKILGFGYKLNDTLMMGEETMKIARIHSGYHEALLNLKTTRMNYENSVLRAPIHGHIANLQTKLYEYPKGEEFCQVINDQILEVDFSVLETEYHLIKKGQDVVVSTFFDTSVKVWGKITEINPTVSEKGLINVRAQIKNPGNFIDGMNVKVFVESNIPGQFVVPKSAVLIRDNYEVLFRIGAEGKAEWVYIQTMMTNSDSYSVIPLRDKHAELFEGDIVITSGNLNLAHDSRVEIE